MKKHPKNKERGKTYGRKRKQACDLVGNSSDPSPRDIEIIENHLTREVEMYDDFLQGNIYYVVTYDKNENIDNCSGFYEDHNLVSYGEQNIAEQLLGDDLKNFKEFILNDTSIVDFESNIEEWLTKQFPENFEFVPVKKEIVVNEFRYKASDLNNGGMTTTKPEDLQKSSDRGKE